MDQKEQEKRMTAFIERHPVLAFLYSGGFGIFVFICQELMAGFQYRRLWIGLIYGLVFGIAAVLQPRIWHAFSTLNPLNRE